MAVTPTLPDDTDFKSMGPELGRMCGDNAANWAGAYCQITDTREDWSTVVGWFANAIECADQARHGCAPVVLPDGSAVLIS